MDKTYGSSKERHIGNNTAHCLEILLLLKSKLYILFPSILMASPLEVKGIILTHKLYSLTIQANLSTVPGNGHISNGKGHR